MGLTLADVFVKIASDDSQLKSGLKSAESQTKSWVGSLGGMLQTGIGFAIGGAINAGINAVVGSLGSLKAGMIDGNAQFEQYNTQFGVLLGSTEAAQERMAALAEFGQKTPFELPEVVEADKILQGFGLHAAESAQKFGFSGEQIRTIAGDVASGTGSSFQEMALLIGKFSSGATGEAISRMQELGITNRDELSKMGLEFDKSGQLLSPLPESMETILGLMEKKYGGLMDAQSKTFSGMMSNLSDWASGTLRTIGQPIFEVLKDKLQVVLEFLGSPAVQAAVAAFAAALATGLGYVMDAISQLGASFGGLGGIFNSFGVWLAANEPLISGFREALLALFSGDMDFPWEDVFPSFIAQLLYMIPSLQEVARRVIDEVIPAFLAFVSPIIAQVIPGLQLLAQIIMGGILLVIPLLIQYWNMLIDNIDLILPVLAVVGAAIMAMTSPIALVIGAIVLLATAWANNWGGIQEKTKEVLDFIMPYINSALTAIQTWWAMNGAGILASVSEAWENIKTYVMTAINVVMLVITNVLASILAWWQLHGEAIMTIVGAYFVSVQTIVQTGIAVVLTVILATLAFIQSFWQAHGDTIMTVVNLMWENIKVVFNAAVMVITAIIQAFSALIQGDWRELGEQLRVIWDTVWNALGTIMLNGATALTTVVGDIINTIMEVWNTTDWGVVGVNIITGIAAGITNSIMALTDAAKTAAQAALDTTKGFFGIESPSKLMEKEVGANISAGIGKGITGGMGGIQAALNQALALPDMSNLSLPPFGGQNAAGGDGSSSTANSQMSARNDNKQFHLHVSSSQPVDSIIQEYAFLKAMGV